MNESETMIFFENPFLNGKQDDKRLKSLLKRAQEQDKVVIDTYQDFILVKLSDDDYFFCDHIRILR